MQPYIFPYIGYFQLLQAVNKFIFYDDVNFIKQGWVNRNQILVNSQSHLFSVPVEKISSFKKINETAINQMVYDKWRSKFLKQVEQTYKKAPYFEPTYSIIREVLVHSPLLISDLAKKSVTMVADYLSMPVAIEYSSEIYNNTQLKGQDRVLDICQKENASVYVNVPGGRALYAQSDFTDRNIDLQFIQPIKYEYNQFKNDFIPWLSIIDVLMFNDVEIIKNEILPSFQLTK